MSGISAIQTKRLGPSLKNQQGAGVIKFNLVEENKIRIKARKQHDLVKQLTELGYKIRKVQAASRNESILKQFKMASGNEAIAVDIYLPNNEGDAAALALEIRDFLQLHDNFTLHQDVEILIDNQKTRVQRYLLTPKKITDDDVINQNMKVPQEDLKEVSEISPMVKRK